MGVKVKQSMEEAARVLPAHIGRRLKKMFDDRWDGTTRLAGLHHPIHAAAYMCDPEYQGSSQNSEAAVQEGWEFILLKFCGGDAQLAALVDRQWEAYSSKMGGFSSPLADANRSVMSPFDWWSKYGAAVPELRAVAKKIFSCAASSSSAERNWSIMGWIYSPRRNGLSPWRQVKLAYVHESIQLVNRCNAVEFMGTDAWQHSESESSSSSESEGDSSDQ